MIKLKTFTSLNRVEFYLVLAWRNDPNISHFMKNQNISLEQHSNFFNELETQEAKKYFLVFDEDEPIGIISFVDIDKTACSFGLYANPYLRGKGQVLMDELKNYAFETLKLEKIEACVFKENEKALNLYLRNGFNIYKEDETMFYIKLNNGGGEIGISPLCENKRQSILILFLLSLCSKSYLKGCYNG